ncbi:hypothetical protein CHU98_g9013 [Xylaria longipes]|nr:hypothetical protein CHU98_g9013 [Xylaria longipes]
MEHRRAPQRALTRRRGQSKKPTRGVNLSASLNLPRSRKGKNTGTASKTKPRTRQLTKQIPQAIPAIVSRHRMTLRSRDTHVSMNNRDSDETTQLSHVGASSLPAFSTTEPVVRASSRMPLGYSLVPKGDPYVTRNCRQRTRQAHQVVYAVVDDEKKQVGIRVPLPIYATVLESASATRGRRQLIVRKRDEDLEKRFRGASKYQVQLVTPFLVTNSFLLIPTLSRTPKLIIVVLARFPRIPPGELRMIIRHATKKGKGRVGRTGRKEMAEKAYLAAQAYIRHTKTNYEGLLRSGTNREVARILTARNVFGVLNEWGPVTTSWKVETARKKIPMKYTQKTRDGATPLKSTAKTAEELTRARRANRTKPISDGLRRTEKTTIVSPGNAAKGASVTSLAVPASANIAMRRNGSGRQERHKRRRAKMGLGT